MLGSGKGVSGRGEEGGKGVDLEGYGKPGDSGYQNPGMHRIPRNLIVNASNYAEDQGSDNET